MPMAAPISNIPVPDPSTLTTKQIRHELKALRDLLETRLIAMDKASVVLAENVNRVPTLLDREISRIAQLQEEKFASVRSQFTEKFVGITTQFHERDIRTDSDKGAASTAINAALSALKEMITLQNTANAAAIAKSEASTTKELESLNRIIASTKDGLSSDIRNLASRLDRGEASDLGAHQTKTDTHMTTGSVMAVVGGVVGVLGLVFAIGLGGARLPGTAPSPSPIGIDSKRIDDLVNRIDALSRRIDVVPPAPAPAPVPVH
jgi:hypothetical protein